MYYTPDYLDHYPNPQEGEMHTGILAQPSIAQAVATATPEAPGAPLRLSDEDRLANIAQIGEAWAEGRLELVEFDDRSDGIIGAATHGELEQFFADIPQNPVPPAVPRTAAPTPARRTPAIRKGVDSPWFWGFGISAVVIMTIGMLLSYVAPGEYLLQAFIFPGCIMALIALVIEAVVDSRASTASRARAVTNSGQPR